MPGFTQNNPTCILYSSHCCDEISHKSNSWFAVQGFSTSREGWHVHWSMKQSPDRRQWEVDSGAQLTFLSPFTSFKSSNGMISLPIRIGILPSTNSFWNTFHDTHGFEYPRWFLIQSSWQWRLSHLYPIHWLPIHSIVL